MTPSVRFYRKKPVVIEAVEVPLFPSVDDLDAIATWCGGMPVYEELAGVVIETLEGTMHAGRGDYVIRGVKGEFYPCKSDIFEATYEASAPMRQALCHEPDE